MDPVLQSLISGLPTLVVQFAAAAAVYVAGIAVYARLTPYHELDLVRNGNVAAAVTLGGALIGLALPVGATLARSLSVADILVWGAVATVMQAAAFGLASLMLRELPARVERGDLAAALVASSVQISVGIVNAGAMSG
jgi:putative membrane protein